MVTRREAALAAAARGVLANWERGDLAGAVRQLGAALAVKAKPTRRRAVLRLSQGKVSLAWADKGVRVTVHDEDNARTRYYSSSLKPGQGDRVKTWEDA